MNENHPFFARRWSRRQLIMLDLAAALGFAFVFFTAAVTTPDMPLWMKIALPCGLGLPLAVRRLWPLPVFCLTLLLAVTAAMVDAVAYAYIAPAFAMYIVAMSDRLGTLIPSSAIGVVSMISVLGLVVAGGAPREGAPFWLVHIDQPLVGIAALGGAWTIGRAVRERRLYAARDAERFAEHAVTQERLRIARELHDVVTHSVGLIAVKAGVANHVLATRPEEAHDALRVIETASRSALVEMRHLLGVLRSNQLPDFAPVPGIAGLEGLAEQARQAGVAVELDLRIGVADTDETRPGDRVQAGSTSRGRADRSSREEEEPCEGPRAMPPNGDCGPHEDLSGGATSVPGVGGDREATVAGGRRLPDGVELSVYRLVQEALTNVVKHASPTRCRVSVAAEEGEVRIEVIDEGPGKRSLSPDGAGHGLIGMRERVMMYGGVFEAGNLPRRGFRVFACLPYQELS
ncbi:histidine kinase [Nonomuraea spiralis]|uniref:histidine kinase n=1 Tax=Nonomuraea spiralis TaxID=46182 RepID=A0ABV5IJ29_9ACTN|nr:histidine kinase [Nonomuraea spiralis]